jgi:hypothetical protein
LVRGPGRWRWGWVLLGACAVGGGVGGEIAGFGVDRDEVAASRLPRGIGLGVRGGGRVRGDRWVVAERGRRLPLDVGGFGDGAAAEAGEPLGDEREVLEPLLLGDDRQDVVPERQERAAELQPPVGARQEPHVQVRRTVAPTVHVNPRDAVEGPDRSLEPHCHDAELRGQQVRQVADVEVRTALEDQDDRQARGTVHAADAPSLTDPDVRVVGGVAGDTIGGVLTAARGLHRDRLGKVLHAHVTLEREGRPACEVGERRGVLGHDVTLAQATGHCPGSISREPADAPSPVQPMPRTSTPVTFGSSNATPRVIHKSYPQAAPFHVKHDVERVHPLWIQGWRSCHPSELFHVKRPRGASCTVSAHSLWILPLADPVGIGLAAKSGGAVVLGIAAAAGRRGRSEWPDRRLVSRETGRP